MKKCILSVIILAFLHCNSESPTQDSEHFEFDELFSIQTEKSSYILQDQFSSEATITNNEYENVKIYNSSCGGPLITLEKFQNNNWIAISQQPICDRIPDDPIELSKESQIETIVKIQLPSKRSTGQYRLRFKITGSNNEQIKADHLTSNAFQLIKQE